MPVPGWLAETWDRVVASDPGLTRLQMAGAAAVSMASALGVEYAFATATHAGPPGTVIAMLLGAVMAMMGSMALSGRAAWPKVRTAVFFPFAIGSGMLAGVAVGDHTDMMLAVFVVVMFAAVAVRRFGIPFFFYGFMGWMGYFFASFLHSTLAMLPSLLAAIGAATGWVLLLSVTVLRVNTTRTLHRTVSAFGARARSVARACADLLAEAGGDPRQRERLRRRVHSQQTRLAETALMVEAWSAEEGALPPQLAATLRRRLIDAQQVIDRMVAASGALADGDPVLAHAAARTADRLARRDDTGANREAHALAETAEHSAEAPTGERLAGWLCARHFAVAALEFVKLAREADARDPHDAEDGDDDADGEEHDDGFEAVVALALGNLPGSPAVAHDVPARGGRWNPLTRLDMTTRQSIQVAVAGAMAILLGRELSPVRYYWAVIAAFVMFSGTATRAEAFLKGVNRVVGTLVGLVASLWLAEVTAGSTPAVLVVIVASMFLGFYLFRVSYAYMIFFVTIMVGQLYSALHEFSSGLLVLRLEETAIGAAAGMVVALTVAPLSTRDTVRTVRDNLLTALADVLGAAADRLDEAGTRTETSTSTDASTDLDADADEETRSLDALARTLDDRMRQLTIVARPLTRPLVWGNSPRRTRHRMALYAATTTHARTLAVALRQHPGRRSAELADACRALAQAATQITEAAPGAPRPAVAEPLARADAVLFSQAPAAPGIRATDPVIGALIHLQNLLQSLAVIPPADLEPVADATELVGTITDSTGEPLHGRVVLLADTTARRQVATAYSDSAGHYRIDRCPPGKYLAVATARYFQPSATRVVLRAAGPTHTDFTVLGRGRPASLVHTKIIVPDRHGDVVTSCTDPPGGTGTAG